MNLSTPEIARGIGLAFLTAYFTPDNVFMVQCIMAIGYHRWRAAERKSLEPLLIESAAHAGRFMPAMWRQPPALALMTLGTRLIAFVYASGLFAGGRNGLSHSISICGVALGRLCWSRRPRCWPLPC